MVSASIILLQNIRLLWYIVNYEKQIVGEPDKEYRNLRSRIDEEIERLEGLHGQDITCRPGCAACCINLTVFPVEFFAILEDLEETHTLKKDFIFDESAPCGFLHGGLCQIYLFRPIICRTHGLPIIFLNDSQEEPVWEVSFCEFNFQNKTGVEFTDDTLLDIETINTELNRINDQFITSPSGNEYYTHRRIRLKELCKNLNSLKEDPQRTC
jgi:Fe-S-cluster containining protein